MRADINLSVREAGAKEMGTRTEMKNLNSFKAIGRAIEGERQRQIDILESGGKVVQETRRWDDHQGISIAMRSKEDAHDYRYFPDPDLPPVEIRDDWLERIRQARPEMREEKRRRYQEEFGLPQYDAEILTSWKKIADVFEETTAICGRPKEVSNWLMVEGMRLLKEKDMDVEGLDFSPENLAALIRLVEKNVINRTVAKAVFEEIFWSDVNPETYVEEHGLKVVNDIDALARVIEKIIAENPQSVRDFKKGKKKAAGFLVGQTMRAMEGKAEPGLVNQLVKEQLSLL